MSVSLLDFISALTDVNLYSDGEATSGLFSRVFWDGSKFRWCHDLLPPGGISCPDVRPWWFAGGLDQGMQRASLSFASCRPEACIVQLFVEAKRHQPSVIYIPSLTGWYAAIPGTPKPTVGARLYILSPFDLVLLFAAIEGPFSLLPRDVRACQETR